MILPAMSKIWEITFKSAIEKELGMVPFQRNQFRFRKRKSTIDATSQVCKFTNPCRKKGIVWVMMCIDVKNAFNFLRWEVILVATLDLGNFQRFRGTKRFILKALCRQALGVIDISTAPSPNFRETAHAAIVADF